MDTSDPDISFDENGVCNHCEKAIRRMRNSIFGLPSDAKAQKRAELVKQIKRAGAGKPYDCLIGLSGGVDSSYLALSVKELGLRPLAIHLDNGWDSETSIQNIEKICTSLSIDLETRVLDWEEFKALQLAFLRASTPDSEIPSDHAIVAAMYDTAYAKGIAYILVGYNLSSESILPKAWSQGHFDWRYIQNVYHQYGPGGRLRRFPNLGKVKRLYYEALRGIRFVSFLEYFDYNKEKAKTIVAERLGWKDYGRKHGESNYTRIYQEYILPRKFGFDKRRAHYSSLIAAGQLTRDAALSLLAEPLYARPQESEQDIAYLMNKLDITRKDFDAIMASPPRSIRDFKNYDDWAALQIVLKAYRKLRTVGRGGK